MARVIRNESVQFGLAELNALQGALSGFPMFLAPPHIQEAFTTATDKLSRSRVWQADGDIAKSEVTDADLATLDPKYGTVTEGVYTVGSDETVDSYYASFERTNEETDGNGIEDAEILDGFDADNDPEAIRAV